MTTVSKLKNKFQQLACDLLSDPEFRQWSDSKHVSIHDITAAGIIFDVRDEFAFSVRSELLNSVNDIAILIMIIESFYRAYDIGHHHGFEQGTQTTQRNIRQALGMMDV